jgi:hypothetical protein
MDVIFGMLMFPVLQVLGDGSLYLETVGFHIVGNLSCYDRQKPSLKQIHQLTVQSKSHPVHVLYHQSQPPLSAKHNICHICHRYRPKPVFEPMQSDQGLHCYLVLKFRAQDHTNEIGLQL